MTRALLLGLGVLLLAPVLAHADVQVAKQIDFKIDGGKEVSAAIRDGCKLQSRVPEYLAAYSKQVRLVDRPSGAGRILELHISEVHAPGGGAFSGPKWMSVRGTLRDNGAVIGTFRAKRISSGGAFGQFKGTCSIIARSAKVIGRDIAGWLEAPTKDAKLGNAK